MHSTPWQNDVLWHPRADAMSATRIGAYMQWLAETSNLHFTAYDQVWEWSVQETGAFWCSIRDFFELPLTGESAAFSVGGESPTGLPGAVWFADAHTNYAQACLEAAGTPDESLGILAFSQTRAPEAVTFGELRAEVARVRRGLVTLGVTKGDRVGAYAPNIPETIVMFLACASLGAIWSSCAPEFGTRSVLDRFLQIAPKVLFVVDGYRYGHRTIARHDEIASIVDALGDHVQVIHLGYVDEDWVPSVPSVRYAALDGPSDPGFVPLPFDHPLYILYSSGTTGLPKPIVHCHGGILLEHTKALALHGNLGPDDRFFWFTTTGWMMWNYLVSGLVLGTTLVLFDGDPGADNLDTLWALAETAKVTSFGVSAPFIDACRHAEIHPASTHDLATIVTIGSTGAPLVEDGYRWIIDEFGPLMISSISGGTDVCTAFVGAVPIRDVRAGVIPCRFLGADVAAFDPMGNPVVGTQGELVVRTPMPSMPIGFWGDDGTRMRAAYFTRYPNTWHHGDWITIAGDGSVVISGRSDATLNRGGVRLGTADFYAVVEQHDDIADALVIHLDDPRGGPGVLILFVVLIDGHDVSDELRLQLHTMLRTQLSPRHVPDRIVAVHDIPRTLSGKKLEVPVKKLLRGVAVQDALTPGSLANPTSVDEYVAMAHTFGNDTTTGEGT